jgi:hypothetical protein
MGMHVLHRVSLRSPCFSFGYALTFIRDQVYFKNSQVREMDSHFGDLYGIISDREIEISHELAQFVLEYEALFIAISDICGEIDR